ncbi:hypothetical protein ABZS88_44610 [Streptomyces sp. NPDC005480]|uniref:hypothetical protein n=1 Tax=Streptomyces sp. NPDC005480 TaxID=3154880 RepID=UPI0033B6A2EF
MRNLFERRPKPQGRHTPNLWPVWAVAPLALIVVGARAFGPYRGADALLTAENKSKNWVDVQDVIKTAVTVITLIGAVLAGLYAYRKQLLSEGDSHRADANQLAERYSKAAEQLGHDQAAVRLAGVYAMARLADDWPEQRQVCIDVLCASLRMPYEADPTEPEFMKGEREVRLTIIRTIRDQLQDPTSPTAWCGHDLDFTGATFDGGDFSRAAFTGGKVSLLRLAPPSPYGDGLSASPGPGPVAASTPGGCCGEVPSRPRLHIGFGEHGGPLGPGACGSGSRHRARRRRVMAGRPSRHAPASRS